MERIQSNRIKIHNREANREGVTDRKRVKQKSEIKRSQEYQFWVQRENKQQNTDQKKEINPQVRFKEKIKQA
jgi:hypothetical protein